MNSSSSKTLIKEEKKPEPVFKEKLFIFDFLPISLQRHALSFLFGNNIEKNKYISEYNPAFQQKSFFSEYKASGLASVITKTSYNLAHRIKVNETLLFIRDNPIVLQSLPFKIEIADPHGRRIRRNSIIGVLVALDEFDVIKTKVKTDTYSLIPTIFSWFNKANDPKSCYIKKQLQHQLEETSEAHHIVATKERRDRYLNEIERFINKVIEYPSISDGKLSENLFDIEFIQDFIKNAFQPDPNDNGEYGTVWDFWQLNLDYIDLLEKYVKPDFIDLWRPGTVDKTHKSCLTLKGWWSTKTNIVDTAVCLAFLFRSQFCHLEAFATGVGKKTIINLPTRFDCSNELPAILTGIGSTHFFDFYGNKDERVKGTVGRGSAESDGSFSLAWHSGASSIFTKLVSNKNAGIEQLTSPDSKKRCLIM